MSKKASDTKGTEKSKKERVLHTRVPAVLDAELKRLAAALRVPVSNVVRTILEDAVDTVDAVGRAAEDELRTVADRLRRGRNAARAQVPSSSVDETPRAPLAGVLGFQPMLVARESRCGLCDAALARATPAFLAIREQQTTPLILCEHCIPFSHRPESRGPNTPDESNHES